MSDDWIYVIRNGQLSRLEGTRAQLRYPTGDSRRQRADDIPVFSLQRCIARVQNPHDTGRGGDPTVPGRSGVWPQTFTHTV